MRILYITIEMLFGYLQEFFLLHGLLLLFCLFFLPRFCGITMLVVPTRTKFKLSVFYELTFKGRDKPDIDVYINVTRANSDSDSISTQSNAYFLCCSPSLGTDSGEGPKS